ncbi:hypothetical protein MY10362_009268 [Beauveria mimosiformis]
MVHLSRVASHRFHNCAALSAKPKYQWIDGAEHLPNYSPGGYHPIEIGSVLHDSKRDIWRSDGHRRVARAIPILRALGASRDAPGSDAVPHLVDEFTAEGPNGTHPCCATAPALANLRDTSFSRLFQINVALRARDSFNGWTVAQFRHKFGEPNVYQVTRTDGEALTPNVPGTAVVALEMGKKAQDFSIQDARLMLADVGESFIPASQVRRGQDCHTVFDSRPPEAYFEPDAAMSSPSDVWSLAIAIWDIIGIQPLFSSAF